ncbi:DUF5007 domain-containing protein [Mucilaginibacter sp. UR6-11]|uniref:DUF5007 domain-containing protein n=1 Tax=Mucilaginibacter sp. UR6-11 TaxID=1435644 RepID=UPI001E456142|nr:DUF5007 domain-containing protein [Mucilaginibacter sp. UR6-11]MCC8424881.1 DUF5007 domain-containing protein [Mucilaginibacter sp. UR6-11]
MFNKVNKVMQNTIKYRTFVLLTAVVAFSGCRKIFNLPDEKSYLSTQADYTTKSFSPIMGRTTLYNNIFSSVGSTFPMTFEIKNPRFGDGRDASDMLAVKPTLVWTQEYTGKETSLAQIEAKRHLENHPILEVRGSGDLIWWYTGTKDIIRPADSVIYPQNTRYIDIKITNSGGTRTIKNLTLTPTIDRPYYPTDDYNIITGQPNTTTPGGKVLVHIYPTSLNGIVGATTNQPMNDPQNANTGLVYVYIRKFSNDPNGHRLRIKVLGKDSLAIDPAKFNATKWLDQIHGFKADGTPGPDLTHEYAEYNVAYPIPLAKIPTKYTVNGVGNTTGGDIAQINLLYTRVSFGNVITTARITQNFAIYEKGDWEIVIHFKTVNPKFDND